MKRLPLVAMRAPALLLDAAASIVFVRRFGAAEMGHFAIVLVCGTAAFLILDRGRLGLGQLAVGPRTPWPAYRDVARSRRKTAGVLLLLAVLGLLLDSNSTLVYLPLLVAAGSILEIRWAQLATGARRLLVASYFVRPAVLLAVASLQPTGVSHPDRALVLGALVASASVMWFDHRAALASLPSALDRDDIEGGELLASKVEQATRGRWSVGVAAVIAQMYASGDVVLVALLAGKTHAGVYALGYKPIAALLILIGFQRDVWLARLSAGQELPSMFRVWTVAGAFSVGFGLLAFVVRPLQFLTGVEGADTVCALLVLSTPAILLGGLLYARLLSAGEGRGFVYATGACLLASIGLNLLLVPWGGAKGAAVTTTLTELLLMSIFWRLSRRRSRSQRPIDQ